MPTSARRALFLCSSSQSYCSLTRKIARIQTHLHTLQTLLALILVHLANSNICTFRFDLPVFILQLQASSQHDSDSDYFVAQTGPTPTPPPATPTPAPLVRRLGVRPTPLRLLGRDPERAEPECAELVDADDARRWRCMRAGSTSRCARRANRERTG
ncbi:hypothetical protein C8R47DRAFT_716474 [Mycena vitilis]|nr:hypothetical protein C8R47DRAFT_716474 [Mycena vitilis]